jgi:hypothetical protein
MDTIVKGTVLEDVVWNMVGVRVGSYNIVLPLSGDLS